MVADEHAERGGCPGWILGGTVETYLQNESQHLPKTHKSGKKKADEGK